MNTNSKYMLLILICSISQLISQTNGSASFIKPIPIYDKWSKLVLPFPLDSLSKIKPFRIAEGMDLRQDPQGVFWIKTNATPKRLFHIEIPANPNPYFLLFEKTEMKVNPNDTFSNSEPCSLSFQKFTDRKLYISASNVPDELYAFWDNTNIPLRRNGKTIIIYLPVYTDSIENSNIRIYASKNNKHCKELIIQLQRGKPSIVTESFSGIVWGGFYEYNVQSKDSTNTSKIFAPKATANYINSPSDDIKSLDAKVSQVEKEIKQTGLSNLISVYVDTYYALYNDSVGVNNYQQFASISPRHNTFGLNTAQINFKYDAEKIRGTAVFHYGDYAKSTWSLSYNNIMEAHAGLRLSKKLWLDAGFFRSHIGTEGFLPRENICSSLSIGTFLSTTLVSGVRFNYLPSDKWSINLYILNGYNGFEDNNDKKSIGILITYALNDKSNIGFNNYLGDDTPKDADSISHLRFHQNIYFNYQLNKLKLQLGGDFCLLENADLINSTKSASMLSALATANYRLFKKISVYSRLEYFNDPNSIMSASIVDAKGKTTGYKLWGITAGIELKPLDNFYLRLEGRQLEMDSDQQIFKWKGVNKSNRSEIMMNMGISF